MTKRKEVFPTLEQLKDLIDIRVSAVTESLQSEVDLLKAKADATPVFDPDAAQHVEDALVGEWLTEQLEAGKSAVNLETVELIRTGIRLCLA